ncbi:hypothetical protein CKAH01_17090 [Colletotrichum kahawae]|uniref:Uncharacterized protein n=1 Tax=Colletotrichum kahawae TaxID=34407 RepID=A0AAD9YB30_COLKA|nr:hypothetical protein CKAH01_17090 [Colletotrichum kahawae]
MDAATTTPYVKRVDSHNRQNTKYHFALEDLNRARAKYWIAHNDSEMKLMIYKAHAAHLAYLEVERDAADAALKQLVICLKTGEERLARAQRRLDKADEVFQREAEQHRVLPIDDRDVSVTEDYQTPPPENKHTSSPTEQVEGCTGVFDGTTGPHSSDSAISPEPSLSEPSSETSPEPSVVYIGPVRTSRARSIAARHRPYFRSAGNIMRWQMQQLEGEDSESDAEESEASSERLARAARRLRERLAKSPEVEYFGETVRQELGE